MNIRIKTGRAEGEKTLGWTTGSGIIIRRRGARDGQDKSSERSNGRAETSLGIDAAVRLGISDDAPYTEGIRWRCTFKPSHPVVTARLFTIQKAKK